MSEPLIERLIDLAIEIQQVPAPTLKEKERAELVYNCFQAEKLSDVKIDELGNVYGRLPGKKKKRPLILTAHMDTVFPENTDLAVQRSTETISGPGIGDNSVGVAGLLGLVWLLRQREINLPGDLWLVANVGEEGLGNLRGMKAVVDRFDSHPLAYIIVEGMALGQIYRCGLSVQRYRITVETAGGHSWVDFGQPSAVHALAHLVTQITALIVPSEPRSSLNVGTIQGGTSINTIAARAEMELDLRSEDSQALAGLVEKVETLVRKSQQSDVKVTAEVIGQRPFGEISMRHPLIRLAGKCLKAQGITPHFNAGSTDANVPLSRGLPAVCVGLTTGCGAHTTGEYIHTSPLAKGMEQLASLVEMSYHKLD